MLLRTLPLLVIFVAAPAWSQIPDHLKCYRITDSLKKAKYTADLQGLAPEPGCTISVPAVLACIETQKENVRPEPPGAPGRRPAGDFLCYKTKCQKAKYAVQRMQDQFGDRTVRPAKTGLLCAPARAMSVSSTTTTTSTTLPCATCDDVRCPSCSRCTIDDASGDAYCAGTCDDCPCPDGTRCALQPVLCVREPCPPVAQCVPVEPCDAPIEAGPCDAAIPRWGFDGQACVQFLYGGCGGNANNFSTAAECRAACVGVDGPRTTTTSVPTTTTTLPACDPPCGACSTCRVSAAVNAAYCHPTCDDCPCPTGTTCRLREVTCVREPCPPVAQCVPDERCTAPVEPGPCDAAISRWAFSPSDGECRQFLYGGCGGNANNYETKAACERVCGGRAPAACTDPCDAIDCGPTQECRIHRESGAAFCADTCDDVRCPADAHCELVDVTCVQEPCPPVAQCVPSSTCDQPLAVGPCKSALLRWYHDPTTSTCEAFTYSGCGGNDNNFASAADCENACPPAPACEQPAEPGPCLGAIPRWRYDTQATACVLFMYGGCGGNENNFATKSSCEAACP